MKTTELEARIKALEVRQQATDDIEAIKKLQQTYGFYIEHWQEEEIVELFSRDS